MLKISVEHLFQSVTAEIPMTLTGRTLFGLFLFIPGLLSVNVVNFTCAELTICALQGQTVKVRCLHPPNTRSEYQHLYWFKKKQMRKWRDKTIPEDLSTDPEYKGRLTFGGRSFFEIRDVRKSDEGVYRFRFKAESFGWINSVPGIKLIVTNLQIKKDSVTNGQGVKLTCTTNCTLSDDPAYIWYRNAKTVPHTNTFSLSLNSVNSRYTGSYSCAIKGYEDLRAPAVCLQRNCLDVSYTPKTICGFPGSYVDLPCTYTFPRGLNISETLWVNSTDLRMEPEDLTRHPEYVGRVEYRGNGSDCTLRITDLRKSDSSKYRFLLKTQGTYFNSSAVSLSVTDLYVHVYPDVVDQGASVSIWCHTQCGLPQGFGGFILYKDGQRITSPNGEKGYITIHTVSSEDAGSYSCALIGQDGLPSLEATLTVTKGPVSVLIIVLVVVVLLTVAALLVFTFSTLKRRNMGGHDIRMNVQTVNNDGAHLDVSRRESSPNYENVEHIYADPDEFDDTYTALRRGHWHSVYDIIQRRESPQNLD
ncbi:neural cell adhesion molecule 2-like [Oncorhynchus clarkii lewisi]|uniref:neural cell adhesion molecule 2-like n=1 Tax=Oncorhynchus clarkii lewisi TaxID=490388 RepID=UPI0039B83558